MKKITTDKDLENLKLFGKLHFYKMLKSASEADTDENPLKFNYLNISLKLKPELESRLITEGINHLETKLERLIFPYGHQNSSICIFHPFQPEEPDKNESEEYHFAKESSLSPRMFLKSKIFKESEAFQKIKGEIKLDNELRRKVHSLLNLEKLENHINSIIEEIKNSDLRNYVSSHETELFQDGAIFKVYRGQEQIDRLKAESAALEFFQKKLPELHTPKVYCHGKLGEFYVLVIEKIEGITVDEHIKNSKNNKQETGLLEQILDSAVKIWVEGYTNNVPTLYGNLTEKSLSEWLNVGIINKLGTEKSRDLLQKIKSNYSIINRLLLNSSFLYNKDIPTKNWLVKKNGNLCAIDFENTHFGPIQLDLVTLFEGRNGFGLKERELIPTLKNICGKINSYVKKENKNLPEFEEQDFVKTYFAASVHRNLSMAGTNKEQNNQKQMVQHLKKARYSVNRLQKILKDEKDKESLQILGNNIYGLCLSYLQ